jgi:ABC-type multidrug transport system fused ATPase/permease subunit
MARRKDDDKALRGKMNRESIAKASYIFKFISPYKWYLIFGMVLLFLSSGLFMVFPFLAGELVDIAQGNSEFEFNMQDIAWVLVGLLVAQGLISYFRVTFFAQVSERGLADIRKALYDKLLTLPIFFFEDNRVGELVSRISADIEKLYSAFSITIAEFVRQIIILVLGIVFLAITTPRLAGVMLLTFPVIVIGAMIFGRYIRRLSKERQEQMADTNNILSETMQSIATVKSFVNELLESTRYRKSTDEVVRISLTYARGRALFAVFIVSILFGCVFFIIWQGALMVQNGTLTAGGLISFVSYTAIIGGAIAGLGSFYTELLGALGATERVRSILREEGEFENITPPSSSEEQLAAQIRFENVHFSYPSRPDVKVLDGISFEVQPGQQVALVGASGAGKSTLFQLMLRFYDGYDGAIYLGDKEIQDVDLSCYRSHFAIVPQEVILFGGTIRENIGYGKQDASEAEIKEAAEQANAWEFIERFPEGLDTIVGERGVRLSGGQKQRIAIARAILKDPAILLLDEATSSLDAESEQVVQAALNNLMKGRTSIIIAHRLATIRDVDEIIVIEHGKVVETGTHESLSAIDNGLYRSLARLQFSGDAVEL